MIDVRSISFAFDDDRVLDEVSLRIDDGEFVILVGANGSGKTTLLRHLNGLLTPDEGTVFVDGTPVQDDLVEARSKVAMVFQHPRDQFVAATVEDDVAFGPENLGLSHDEIGRRVTDALEAVNLEGRGNNRIDTLSGGEQARVAIAGALAMEPTHLVLDEPFTGLDLSASRSVRSRLESLAAEGTGIVVATHDPRDLWSLVDRVIALADGRVVLDAPPEKAVDRLESLTVRVPRCPSVSRDR